MVTHMSHHMTATEADHIIDTITAHPLGRFDAMVEVHNATREASQEVRTDLDHLLRFALLVWDRLTLAGPDYASIDDTDYEFSLGLFGR